MELLPPSISRDKRLYLDTFQLLYFLKNPRRFFFVPQKKRLSLAERIAPSENKNSQAWANFTEISSSTTGSFLRAALRRNDRAFMFPLRRSLDQEGAVCLRQESNLASGKCCRGLLLKSALAWGNSESKKPGWMFSRASGARDFFIPGIISCF